MADAEPVVSATPSLSGSGSAATPSLSGSRSAATMSLYSEDMYDGHAGDRFGAEQAFEAEARDIYAPQARAAYMHDIYRARRPTFLRTSNKQAVTYSNNPVKQSMSMNFGALLTRDRNIKLRNGSILASRGSSVIKCNKKTAADVHVINGFLRTEYPYGAKVGGAKYSLVSLIPKVLKSLPGTVSLSL